MTLKPKTLVRVTKTNEEMSRENCYSGKFDKGDVAVIEAEHTWHTGAFRLEGDESSGCWMNSDFLEVVEGKSLSHYSSDTVEEGDVLICTDDDGDFFWTVGKSYEVYKENGDLFIDDDDTDEWDIGSSSDALFHLVAGKKEETNVVAGDFALTPFGELSDEAKGKLLLAYHNGETIQCRQRCSGEWWDVIPSFEPECIYRVEPTPNPRIAEIEAEIATLHTELSILTKEAA